MASGIFLFYFSAPVLGKENPFPGELFRVAFGSNPRPRGPSTGLVIISEDHKPPGAGLWCRWCVLLDEKLGSGSSILKSKNLKCGFSDFGHRSCTAAKTVALSVSYRSNEFSQHPVAPGRALGSSSVPGPCCACAYEGTAMLSGLIMRSHAGLIIRQ